MPLAVVVFEFDPIVRLGDGAVRLETLATAVAVLVALAVAARLAGRTPARGGSYGAFAHPPTLRRDDLLFIALGVVPGAVVGGRLGWAVSHLDYVVARPLAVVDPGQGSAELGLAVVGGALSGGYVAHLLEGPVGRWLHVAAVPTLVAIALGKVADALGGSGQGAPTDLPWGTAYAGAGPWGSLAPATPAHPAQLYEALATFIALGVLAALLAAGSFSRRDGRAFLVAIGLWAVGRAVVGYTWRDPSVITGGPGPLELNAGQLIALAIAIGASSLAFLLPRRDEGRETLATEPSWPDPATRPRF